MKRMLFNATHPEELRVAIVDGQHLIDLDLESAVRAEKKGNIYKAVVTKVEPGLEAAFVDYGAERQGFLPLKEIYRGYFAKYDSKSPLSSVKIAEEISEGQEMVVQVSKDARGAKGAALTTFISLAGRFLVFMPNNPKGGGISRRVSGEERMDLRQVLANLEVGDQHALIARTAGIGRSPEELQHDLDFLLKLWDTIEAAAKELTAPRLIHQESNLIIRSIRDHLGADIAEIVVDDREIYDRAMRFMQQVMPNTLTKLKYYDENAPLFSRFQIEHQIGAAFKRVISLPSGGSIVIDHTEALIAIDVNSARATRGADIEETALQTNLESVTEIARQLRIRDLGGLVVIDLIDMTVSRNQRAVESQLKESLTPDRARVQVGKISRFGLLEMSRQRLRSSISDANYRVCPRCEGTGTIRNVVSSSLNLLRLIEEKALQENTEAIQVILPLDMATYLLNEKRHEVNQLESRLASRIIIIPSEQLSSPQFELKRLSGDELEALTGASSYRQPTELAERSSDRNGDHIDALTASLKSAPAEKPHVQLEQIQQSFPPLQSTVQPRGGSDASGLLGRMWKAITENKPAAETQKPAERTDESKPKTTKPATRRGPRQNTNRRNTQPRRSRNGAQSSGKNGGQSDTPETSSRRQPAKRGGDSGDARISQPKPQTSTQPQSRQSQPRTAQPKKPDNAGSTERRGRSQPNQSKPQDDSSKAAGDGNASTQSTQASEQTKASQSSGQERPTRRDFAAHEPQRRVGHRRIHKPRISQSTEKPTSADPNQLPPASPDIPDDAGNR